MLGGTVVVFGGTRVRAIFDSSGMCETTCLASFEANSVWSDELG